VTGSGSDDKRRSVQEMWSGRCEVYFIALGNTRGSDDLMSTDVKQLEWTGRVRDWRNPARSGATVGRYDDYQLGAHRISRVHFRGKITKEKGQMMAHTAHR
jgi:hypothetical protein